MKLALADLTDSRTFWIAVIDAIVSTLSVTLALFFNPVIVDKILTVVLIWQPVVIAWIAKLAVQNVAGIKAESAIAEAQVYAAKAAEPCAEPAPK
jgi:hypothetical protein